MISVVTIGAAVVTVVVSLFNFWYLDLRAPQVELYMPPEARLAQIQNKPGSQAYTDKVYLQPAFVSPGRSQRVAVLKSVSLFVERAGEQQEGEKQCKKFWLDGIGSLTNNPKGKVLTFTYERGAAPLVVTQDTPQDHVLAFELRDNAENPYVENPYFVGKQHYLMTLVAETNARPKILRGSISVSADQATLEERAQNYLKGLPNSRKFVTIGARHANTPADCST